MKHGSNLRRAPNTSSAILENLNTGDSVSLVSSAKRLGYYHVRAQDGTAGWVWSKNLNVVAGIGSTVMSSIIPAGLLAQLAASTIAAVPKPLVINGHAVCGPKGNAIKKKFQDLDSEKNRTDIPTSYITLTWDQLDALPANNHAHYEGAPVTVEGYLSSQVKQETGAPGESTNCNLLQPSEVDWHIYLTKQPNQPIKNAVIAETTPRTRPLHHWQKSVLDNVVNKSTKVRFSGWLMYDFQHVGEIGVHRASVWEVHPITKIEIADGNGGWKDIEQ
ncbi:MAG: SH3 domain-containing protein [Terriglobales bacterium]